MCDGPHTPDYVQLVCGQRAVCQWYCSLSGRSQQHQQQHFGSHVGCCHLQREALWHVEDVENHLYSKRNSALMNKVEEMFIGT
jgi:hypothetical protein